MNVCGDDEDATIVKIVTHDGKFHLDDVLACWVVSKIHANTKIERSRDADKISRACFAIDVGRKYDPKRNLFDHHFEEKFYFSDLVKEKYNVHMSSIGMVFKEYGATLVKVLSSSSRFRASGKVIETAFGPGDVENVLNRIYMQAIMEIDAVDNGLFLPKKRKEEESEETKKSYEYNIYNTFNNLLGCMNDRNVYSAEQEQKFELAKETCGLLFEARIVDVVERYFLEKRQIENIEAHLITINEQFVLFDNKDYSTNIKSVKKELEKRYQVSPNFFIVPSNTAFKEYTLHKTCDEMPIPLHAYKSWASGRMPGVGFIHHGRFIAKAHEYENLIAMISNNKSVEN